MKKIYTIQAKAIVHTVRTYKKFAESIDEAREMVAIEPESFINEDKVCSQLNGDCRPICADIEEIVK